MKNEQNVPQVRFKGFTDAWEQRKLGECFDERTERSADGELIAVTINSGVVKASELNRHDNSSEDKSNYKVVRVNDIAYNSMRMWQGASGYSQYDGILSPAYTVVIPRENVNPVFFSYMFKRTDMIHEFQINSQGLTSDTWNLKFPAFSTISANVPKSEEQQAIGNYFTNLDNLITLHQRSYNLEQKSKTTNAWEQRKLSDIVERVTRKNENLESELPLTISAQYGLIDQNEFFDKRIASRDVSGYYLLKKGEFAYNKSTSSDAPWGAVKRLDRYEMGVLSTLYIVFALKEDGNIDSDFLVSYYDTDCWHKGVQAIAAEGARNHGLLNITPADYFETVLTVPSDVKEQHQIGTFFARLDNLITLHQRNSYGLHLPQGLYPSAIAWS